MSRVLIADNDAGHAATIKAAIVAGYGSDINSDIEVVSTWNGAVLAAGIDTDVVAIVRSYTGVESNVVSAQSVYPRVLCFMPLGSNTFQELSVFTAKEPPVIVTSGAGDAENQNNTGYGKGMEFWDTDLDASTSADMSSFSNGYICGKLLKIKDTLECDWWEARYRARMTAARTEANRLTSMWDLRNGYGKIDVTGAGLYEGLIPTDPYLTTANEPKVKGLSATIATRYGNGTFLVLNSFINQSGTKRAEFGVYLSEAAYDAANDQLDKYVVNLTSVSNGLHNAMIDEAIAADAGLSSATKEY